MTLSDFDYELPEELTSRRSLPVERDAARMLVLHRDGARWEGRMFRDLPEYHLATGDCLVVNESRVFPSRLLTGRIEIMLRWNPFRAMRRNGGRWFARARNSAWARKSRSTRPSPQSYCG